MIGECRLCESKAQLQYSHIIPKFAGKWLKESSPTGYLRGHDVNRPLQDLRTVELLCAGCEQRFGRWESQFAREIFHPLVEGRAGRFEYGDWLLKLAVSLAWRTAVTSPDPSEILSLPQNNSLAQALRRWRRYLLGVRDNPGPYSHHLFIARDVEVGAAIPPAGFYSYLYRSCDSTFVFNKRDLASYTKLGAFLFVSHVIPRSPVGWHGTKLSQAGSLSTTQVLDNGPFAGFLAKRHHEIFGGMELSPRQKEIMHRDLAKNADKAIRSQSLKVIRQELAAAEVRGDSQELSPDSVA